MNGQTKRHYFETSGFSMWPFLRQKDRIIVEEVPARELISGDIILYKSQDKSTCHRLIKKERSLKGYIFFTRGDYVPSWNTDKVLEEQVLGRVSGFVRLGKLISLRTPRCVLEARVIMFFSPFVAFLFSSLSKLCPKR
jgi:signal peptidase I